MEETLAPREAERVDLQQKVGDLKKIAPREGEWARIGAEQTRLSHGSSLLAGAQSSLEALSESEGACLAQLAAVAARLGPLATHGPRLAAMVELLATPDPQAVGAHREACPADPCTVL